MLRIYFADETNIDDIKGSIIHDVEAHFNEVKLDNSEQQNKILRLLEHAKYKSETEIIDRFGDKLSTYFMSTGTKAALCTLAFPDKVIDLVECGINARDIIIAVCRQGSILIPCSDIKCGKYSDEIDVLVDNKRFRAVENLNDYLNNEKLYTAG